MSLTVLRRLMITRASRKRAAGRTLWPTAIQSRSFFGIGEIIGILANPGETVRSLAESKRLLEETRAEMLEQKERDSIPPKHTFSPLPGLQYREQEVKVLKTCLSSIPNFTVIFGGTSVGKTALLRQVLTDERYHVIHFDLRMAGFADVSSLFFSFSWQMEQYFVSLASRLEGYDPFEKEALAFKHLRLDTQRRIEKNGPPVKTSDIAHLLEIFQSCLLKYWEFVPANPEEEEQDKESIRNKPVKEWERKKMKDVQDRVKQEMSWSGHAQSFPVDPKKPEVKGIEASRSVEFVEPSDHQSPPQEGKNLNESGSENDPQEESWKPPTKLIPVFFIDEAHKLPALIKDQETMKCILDGLLVLTKQDRLCHVINATSDPFYMNWLRKMNVLTHCTIITIGDPPKKEAQEYFNENLLNTLQKKLDQQPICDSRDHRSGNLVLKHQASDQHSQASDHDPSAAYELGFDLIYDTFGGKLAHLQGFVGDYLNSGGKLRPKQSSPFLQAYALLQYHLVTPQNLPPDSARLAGTISAHLYRQQDPMREVKDPLMMDRMPGGEGGEKFEAKTLLYVISKFTTFEVDRSTGQIVLEVEEDSKGGRGSSKPNEGAVDPPISPSVPKPSSAQPTCSYFRLSREIGVQSVDHLVRNRILDLRWTPPVSPDPPIDQNQVAASAPAHLADVEPVVLPISPVMRAAMQAVLEQHLHENLLA
ncbi:hypothetical protein PTTG_27245 [Puccinia triticina 1-1 BBBD Race 1]|uniref:ATPase domain-containing protein n=2 Tax=Puccinia triticina TaxID=208348 RepID=A0A180GMC3_PUCT1|nr:hypothetical protein PTTG_27245 [Puccinia triticina 1-1 BBBD Race 1]WAR56439.1 hypothetical protein PtB15_7B288 [Puccinia triticina]